MASRIAAVFSVLALALPAAAEQAGSGQQPAPEFKLTGPTGTQMAAAALPPERLQALLSEDPKASAEAATALTRAGSPLLPALVAEMNKEQYLSKETRRLKKLGDRRWKSRMRIAGVIQDISKLDFKVRTTAQGWAPDISFDLINRWWTQGVSPDMPLPSRTPKSNKAAKKK